MFRICGHLVRGSDQGDPVNIHHLSGPAKIKTESHFGRMWQKLPFVEKSKNTSKSHYMMQRYLNLT